MLYLRPANERGETNFDWLNSKHSFSFGHYYDSKHMGFSALRVINDDTVAPGAGFDSHGHRDMEIISYVLEGTIEHKDSMGNSYVIPAGEVQRMSAGTGIKHSEFNHSQTERLKFLQIWIQPNQLGITPSYEQKAIEQAGQLTPLVTPNGKDGSLTIHQDVSISRLILEPHQATQLDALNCMAYLHVISGSAIVSGIAISAGDGVCVQSDQIIVNTSDQKITALWLDLP